MTTTQRSLAIYGVPAMFLCLPLIAMQFTKEVNWELNDFVIGGILLFGTAGVIDLIGRVVKTRRNRLLLSAGVLFILMVIWVELAVGLFGSPWAGS